MKHVIEVLDASERFDCDLQKKQVFKRLGWNKVYGKKEYSLDKAGSKVNFKSVKHKSPFQNPVSFLAANEKFAFSESATVISTQMKTKED